MAQTNFDITPLLVSYLDVHLTNPLLDFLRRTNVYDAKKVTLAKCRVSLKTNMLELVEDEYAQFISDPEVAAEFAAIKPSLEARKKEIFDRLDNEEPENSKKIEAFFANTEVVEKMREAGELTAEVLAASHGMNRAAWEEYYGFTKFRYECGMYELAQKRLDIYLQFSKPDDANYLSALWGRFACHILATAWTEAQKDLYALKEYLSTQKKDAAKILRQRAWLLHWSLFVFFNNQKEGLEQLIEFFNDRVYLQTMENVCPWLLRYYTAAIIMCPQKRKTLLKDTLREVDTLAYMYNDPITQFLRSLYDAFDFDVAQVKLSECTKLVSQDFFLSSYGEVFIREARVLICEMYCTIHRSVDLKMLSEKLQMTEEEAEKWMVDMASSNALDAKIDLHGKQVIINAPRQLPYKLIVDSMEEFTASSHILAANIEGLVNEQQRYLLNR